MNRFLNATAKAAMAKNNTSIFNDEFYERARCLAALYNKNRQGYTAINTESEQAYRSLVQATAQNDRWGVANSALALLYHESTRDVVEILTAVSSHGSADVIKDLPERLAEFVNEATPIASPDWLKRIDAFWIDLEMGSM